MMQVINAQHVLITKLLQKQNALYQELNKRFSSSGSSSGSVDNPLQRRQLSGYRQLNNQDISGSGSPLEGSGSDVHNSVKIVQAKNNPVSHVNNKRGFMEDSNDSALSDEENSSMMMKNNLRKRQTETKNMVKNFAKAIFNYIRKNREKRTRVLTYLGIC